MLRAVPSMIRTAWSTSRAFRSLSFFLAISRTCAFGDLEALVLAGLLGLLLGGDHLAALLLLDRDAGGLLEQHGGRRALDVELEAAVGVDGDDDRARSCRFMSLVLVVELLDELADVDAVLARAPGRPAGPASPARRDTAA